MHTKGKWKLFIGKCGDIIEIQDAHGEPIVGWGGFDDSRRSLEEHQANALLIAAAPELWQACNDALFTIQNESYAKSPEVTATLEDILTKALSKAKGEDDISDLIAGLERAADLFDDVQDRKAKGE